MNELKYLILFSVINMSLSCKKESDSCNLDNAKLYSQTEWKIYAYDALEGTCQQGLHTLKAAEVVTVTDCEYAIVETKGVNNLYTEGLGIRPITGMPIHIPLEEEHVYRYKLPKGSYEILETRGRGCPYSYKDQYRILRYR